MPPLELIDLLNGIFSTIFVIILIVTGMIIASKYFKYKQKTFLYIGFTWLGLTSLWMAKSISVIYTLTTNNDLNKFWFMFIGNFLLPFTAIIWLLAFTELAYKQYRKPILIIYGIFSLLIEISFLYFLYFDPIHLGTFYAPIDADYNPIITTYHASLVALILICGLIIGKISLKSEKEEIKLKGKLIIISTCFIVLGAAIEIISHISITIMIIGKILLMIGAILYYNGWLLPDWSKKLFLQKNN